MTDLTGGTHIHMDTSKEGVHSDDSQETTFSSTSDKPNVVSGQDASGDVKRRLKRCLLLRVLPLNEDTRIGNYSSLWQLPLERGIAVLNIQACYDDCMQLRSRLWELGP